MKGAIVGFGDVAAAGHWPAYAASTELEIVAVVERSAERRALAAQTSSSLRTYATFDELAARERLDFVDICTPPALHGDPMLQAIDCGWHVLCEKPFLLDPAVLDEVRRRARAHDRSVVPAHNWKYAPIVRRATESLRAGAIGRLRHVRIETERVNACPVADPARPNWRRDPAVAGGGILMDHGWHATYLALHWFGEPPVDVRPSLHRPSPGSVEDEALMIVGFASGQAEISLTWNGRVRRNAMRLVGDAGEIAVNDDVLTVNGSVTRFPAALSSGSHHADWFAAMLPDVAAAFRDRARASAAFEEAAACLGIIRSAYDAARVPQPL